MIILFGGGTVLCKAALWLKNLQRPVVVVTSPRHASEVPDGIGRSLAEALAAGGVDTVVSDNVSTDAAVARLISKGTVGLSFGAGWIFRPAFIEKFGGELYNFHGARLPQNRGGGGFSWQILSGSRLGYALVHRLDEGVDTGPVVFMREFVYPSQCRVPIDFYRVLAEEYLAMFPAFIAALDAGAVRDVAAQSEHLSSYWPRLSTEHHGLIDWAWPAVDIERFVCAFDEPYSGASTFVGEERVSVKGCTSESGDGQFHPFQAGLIYRKSATGVFVAATGGSLLFQHVTDQQGRAVMERLRVGDRLHTPSAALSAARAYRAVYTPAGLKSTS
jgi:methionyl-tRNA formyltransferase